MKIPFFTRLLEIKETQLKFEKMKLRFLARQEKLLFRILEELKK